MKKIYLAWVFAALLAAQPLFAAQRVMTAKITGMHCSSCSETITEELKKLPEVADASVDFKTKKAQVVVKDGLSLSAEKIKATVEAAGYKASQIR